MESGIIKGNVGELFVLSNGEIRDTSRLDNYYPNSNVDLIIVNIEDGGGDNTFAQINYSPSSKPKWWSTWFPLTLRGTVSKKLKGDTIIRTFTQYITYVPNVISSLNLNKDDVLEVALTFRQIGGLHFLGAFESINTLIDKHPPDENLSNNLSIAYAYGGVDSGFYQVEYNESDNDYEWVKVERPTAPLVKKSYNMGFLYIQGGYGSKVPIQTVADAQYNLIWKEISKHGLNINKIIKNLEYAITLFSGETNVQYDNPTNFSYVLRDTYDATLLNPLRHLFLTLPEDVKHGYWAGVNFITDDNILDLSFINQVIDKYPLIIIKYNRVVNENKIPIYANKIYNLTFYCDGINVICHYLEIPKAVDVE